ncbi:MAG: DUF819 domain-containing protein [Fidelibacterota bacterium]
MQNVLINHPFGILAVLLVVPAIIFSVQDHTRWGRKLFNVVPPLVFAYFLPTFLSSVGVIPTTAPIYGSIKTFVLPASLLLLTLAVDIKGILRLGPKALIMFLSGTLGIVIGGPISLWIFKDQLPPEIWKGMAALAGSWIGGGANFIAIGQSVKATSTMLAMMVVVDVLVANIWTGILLYLAGESDKIDRWLGADNTAITELKNKIVNFQKSVARTPTTTDYMIMLALSFGCAWAAYKVGNILPEIGNIISHSTWKVIIITTLGVAFSFTAIKRFEGVGASKLGTVMLYLLIGVIGANADLREVVKYPYLFAMGLTWILFHVVILLGAMRLTRSPLFFMAVGSQANVGGAASAPIVASAFHPALASVGVMLGIAGYVLGTYAALICASLLQWVY